MVVRRMGLSVILGTALAASAFGGVRATSDRDVDRAIEATKNYLWGQQNSNGSWQKAHYESRHHLPGYFTTAICTLALLEAGVEANNDPRLARAIDALLEAKCNSLRVIALRSMVLGITLSQPLPPETKTRYQKQLQDDLRWMVRGKSFRGSWGEAGPDGVGDNMCNQFALLALWEAAQAKRRIPPGLFRLAEGVWVERQHNDGGWSFADVAGIELEPDVRMTAAGLSSLYLCWDALTTNPGPARQHEAMDRAWAYLDQKFTPEFFRNDYVLFCIQQLGMRSGRKFIGSYDWYAIGAAKLAEPRPAGTAYSDGEWGPLVRAAFELIFLARGRIPLTFNKLDYGSETDWNLYPRDIARFSDYMKRRYERAMRWQIVRLTDPIPTLLDAPLLLVDGGRALALSAEQWDRLRDYTLRGGTLLFVPVRNGQAFRESVRTALASLYEEQKNQAGRYYELQSLPADHPLYTVQQTIRNGSRILPLQAVGDGTRPLAILCEKDIVGAWQRDAEEVKKCDFDLGVNLFMFTTGKNALSSRMRPVFTAKGPQETRRTIRVAWLKHDGNWNTQPYALDCLSEKLVAENRLALRIVKGAALTPEALKDQHLLWMTGTNAFQLTPAEKQALQNYLNRGGMLFLNAVGGARAFDRSARQLARELGDAMNLSEGEATLASPFFTGKSGDFRGPRIQELNDLRRTVALRSAEPKRTNPFYLYLRGEDVRIVHAQHGLHDTLDGHTTYGARSYMPDSALDLAANIALYAFAGKPQPTSQASP